MFMGVIKTKEFRDVVHGYISVPAEWCTLFIDTPIFQRLKYVEQTSMRPLYPCARHDRFAHSLGVYHLAVSAFPRLARNTAPDALGGINLADYRPAFLAAALMHDCAHAPFSHTFEEHYNRHCRAERLLLSLVDEPFRNDFAHWQAQGKAPAEHEMFSAAIFLKHYSAKFQSLPGAGDPVLVARMITGCTHSLADDPRQQLEDCLIHLINGPAIDLDKLDYIVRDTASSGVNNVSIDVQRLLSAIEIVRGPRRLMAAFRKSALSVLENVLDGRNFLFRWIYSHHTVQYYDQVLRNAVARLDEILSPSDKPGAFLDAVFSEEVFTAPVPFGPFRVYLPCDYDILGALKFYVADIPEVRELLGRRPALIPLWKTQAEFEHIFRDASENRRTSVRARVEEILRPALGEGARCMVISVKPKVIEIENREVFVKLFDEPVAFEDLAKGWRQPTAEKQNVSFFYVFIPRERADRLRECVQLLRAAPV